MEILHVAYGGVIMSDYIRFLNENFDIDKHSVVILGNATDLSLNYWSMETPTFWTLRSRVNSLACCRIL